MTLDGALDSILYDTFGVLYRSFRPKRGGKCFGQVFEHVSDTFGAKFGTSVGQYFGNILDMFFANVLLNYFHQPY